MIYIAGNNIIQPDAQPIIDGWGFDDYWTCNDWLLWYRAMVSKWGKEHAIWKFKETWINPANQTAMSGYAFDTCAPLVDAMRSEGLIINRTTAVDVYNSASDALKKYLVPIGVLAGAGFVYFKFINTPERRMARAIKSAFIRGISNVDATTAILTASTLGIGYYIFTNASSESKSKSYMGQSMYDSAETLNEINKVANNLQLLRAAPKGYGMALLMAFNGIPTYRGIFVKGTDDDLWDAMKEYLDIAVYWDTTVITSGTNPGSLSGNQIINELRRIL